MDETKSIIERIVREHPESTRELFAQLTSFSKAQLDEYIRVAKAAGL
ncbi:MAG: hypothetical protein NC548_32020 [Lachnospiraceae bacterium]|nr:hypothetical protein [Lachnospiraceae bacterium]